MPELPEVERLRLSLLPHLLGARVERVAIYREDVCECVHGGEVVPTNAFALLEGAGIDSLHRLGKHLAIAGAGGPAIEVHLGMSGQVLVHEGPLPEPSEAKATHTHVAWTLRSGGATRTMIFRDPRRFGGVWGFASFDQLRERRWGGLGPDALEVTGEHLFEQTRGSTRSIKAALLDQSLLAGVGNIYADESLFAVGVTPRRLCKRVSREQCERLAQAIRVILAAAIASGGSTLRDYVDADGKQGASQFAHKVYGRGGEACAVCGGVLRTATIAQRTTVWCPTCQK
jgi:formamidopyrimidine-DNA glycosylase